MTKITPEAASDIAVEIVQRASDAALAGDADAYAACFALPVTLAPRNGNTFTCSTRTELDVELGLFKRSLDINAVTAIHITGIGAVVTDTGITGGVLTRMLAGARYVVTPWQAEARLIQDGDTWRITRIGAALGHIGWLATDHQNAASPQPHSPTLRGTQ